MSSVQRNRAATGKPCAHRPRNTGKSGVTSIHGALLHHSLLSSVLRLKHQTASPIHRTSEGFPTYTTSIHDPSIAVCSCHIRDNQHTSPCCNILQHTHSLNRKQSFNYWISYVRHCLLQQSACVWQAQSIPLYLSHCLRGGDASSRAG